MMLTVCLLLAGVVLQLAVTYRWLRAVSKVVAVASAAMLAVGASLLYWRLPGLGSVANVIVTAYSLVNLARLILGRSNPQYLYHSVHRTAGWLALAHPVLLLYCLKVEDWQADVRAYYYLAVAAQIVAAGVIIYSVRRQLRKSALPRTNPTISDGRLPTVTVAVPVRNEGHQLEACLTSILASDYPKLEVLAFDDHSSDHTPEIIKSFAHAGVRFIRTAEPVDGWLAKNQAYDSLAKEANGEYILFCGADVRLSVHSIRQLVAYAESRHKHMLSILPLNRHFTTVPILQAMRYYWELAPPRRFFQRPPVLSSCWLIGRHALQRYGGFASMRQSIAPEATLARRAMLDHDGYGFLRSNQTLDITSEKSFHDQEETAQLRRYPQAHRRPEMVLVFTVGQSVLLIGPLLILVIGLLAHANWLLLLLAALAFGLHSYAFGMIQRRIFPNAAAWKAYAAFLPSIAADIWYLNQSMVLYEFAHVSWKDRNVSKPVMHINNVDVR